MAFPESRARRRTAVLATALASAALAFIEHRRRRARSRDDARLQRERRGPQARRPEHRGLLPGAGGHHRHRQRQRPQHLPELHQRLPAGHAGRHRQVVRRLPRAVLRRAGPADAHQRRLGGDRRSTRPRAFKAASTGDDGNQYFVPVYNYPWVVMYRKSLWEEKGYTVPTTMDEFKALGDQMIADGLVPARPRRLGRLAGHGHVRHPEHAHERLRLPHRPHGRPEKWSDPRVKAVFEMWRDDVLPYTQEGAAGRTWQDAAKAALVDKTAGMYFLGTFAAEQAARRGHP